MERTLEIENLYKSNAKKAINKFFKAHPELDYWKEQFEWMAETGIESFNDTMMADGTYNKDWAYSLHLDQYEGDQTYICIIERA